VLQKPASRGHEFSTSCFNLLDDSTALPDHVIYATGRRGAAGFLKAISERATLSKRFLETALLYGVEARRGKAIVENMVAEDGVEPQPLLITRNLLILLCAQGAGSGGVND
jgi:hypothetical protein